ncbi:hypothetical protein K1T71_012312 [Dendrolimus kikuchii]|uniref:Uncharacterized protein n=1 Tax=Dendrolimus kikuchii TaxID=765133 RepID=A0ACC1CL71_9NEOP|nr:hypothetical protein K1T71_012312 [Dendrolimus kikuchii]
MLRSHLEGKAKLASKKLGMLNRSKQYFTPRQRFVLCKTQVSPHMEYCSHFWAGAPGYQLDPLDSIQRRAVHTAHLMESGYHCLWIFATPKLLQMRCCSLKGDWNLVTYFRPGVVSIQSGNYPITWLWEEQRRAGSSETVTAMVAKKTVVCYKCHKSGHVQKNCPQNVSKQQHKNKKAFQGKPTSKGMLTAMSVALNSNTWYVDSGATSHMTNNKDLYISFLPIEPVPVNVANGDKLSAIGVGKVKVNLKTGEKTISHVFYVPSLVGSLLSVSALTKKGFNVKFNKKGCIILSGRTVIATATHVNNVYQLDVCNNFTCNAATERVVPKVSVLDTLLTSQVTEVAQSDACSSDASQASLAADSEANAPSEKTSRETWHRRLAHLNARSMYIMKNGMVTGINYDEGSYQPCESCVLGKQCRLPFPKKSKRRSKEILGLVHTDLCGPMPQASFGGSRYFLTFIDDFSRKIFCYFLKGKDEVFTYFKTFKSLVENQTGKTIKVLRSDNGTEYVNKQFQNFLKEHGIKHETTIPYSPEQNGVSERANRTIVEKARCMLQDAGLDNRFWAEAVQTAVYIKNRSPTKAVMGSTPEEKWTNEKVDVMHNTKKFDPKSKRYIFVGYCEESKGYRLMDPENLPTCIKARNVNFFENKFISKNNVTDVSNTSCNELLTPNIMNIISNSEVNNINENENGSDQVVVRSDERGHESFEPDATVSSIVSCDDSSDETYVPESSSLNDTDSSNFLSLNNTTELANMAMALCCDNDEPLTVEQALNGKDAGHLDIDQMDVKTAFLNGDLKENVIMEQPEGFVLKGENKHKVYKLNKSIYGLKQAAKCWYDKINTVLTAKMGFKRSSVEPCVYFRNLQGRLSILALYVDDILLFTSSDADKHDIKKRLNEEFEIKDLGQVHEFLGMRVCRQKNKITLDQASFITRILNRFKMADCKPVSTPMEVGLKLTKAEAKLENCEYRNLIGCLMYVAVCTRPDIAHAVGFLSQFNDCYSDIHWKAAKHVLRYLKGTTNYCLVYDKGNFEVCGYVDADWASCEVDRKSYTGYVYKIGNSVISWESRKQKTVALSSTEAEYMALSDACKEGLFIRTFLQECLNLDCVINLFNDNQSAQKLSKNSMLHSRTKHIDVRHHFIRDIVNKKLININMKEMKKEIYRLCKNETKALVKEKRERIKLKEEEKLTENFEANTKLFWREVKKSRGCSSASRMERIKSKAGDVLANPQEVLARWSEYFREMYDDIPDAGTTTESVTDSEESASEITLEEIEWSIRSLKNGKAVGIDSVSAEMIKYGGTCVRDAFLSLCNLCWRTGKVPKDWRRAVIVPLYKGKGSRMECASYRAISLISTASKVYAKIIEKRMRVVSDGLLWDAQGGFRNGRGCMDQVFSLRNIVEKQLAMGRKVFCGFVDLEKAFDRVSTYEGCMACVRVASSRDGRYTADIERRVNLGNSLNGALGKLLGAKNLSQKAQLAVHNAVLVPTLTYGSESWVWKKEHESRVNAVEMRALRKICGVTLADRVRNTEVRKRVGLKESVGVKVRKGMLRWFGHVERMHDERMTKQIYNAKVDGCRSRGRPRHTFHDQIDRVLAEGDVRSLKNRRACMTRVMNVKEASEVCKNKPKWHSVVRAYPARELA